MKLSRSLNGLSGPKVTTARQLRSDQSGSVGIIFGLSMIPLFLMMGVAIDLGRATMLKSRLQAAADAAVLSAGAKASLTQSQRQNLAKNQVLANLGPSASGLNVTVTETEPATGTFKVNVTASLPMTVMKIAQINSLNVGASSEAKTIGIGAGKPLEMALALDNTGSMTNDMSGLRAAAKNLVQTVMDAGVNGNVKVSVVPYVAVVNPNLPSLTYVDTAANAPWTGDWFRGGWIAYNAGCVQNWSGGGSGGAGGGGSGDASDLIELLNPFRRIAQELFGITSAHAADVTPNTIPPIVTTDKRSTVTTNNPAPNIKKTYKVPVGFGTVWFNGSSTGQCEWLTNPNVVSNYELFNRVLPVSGAGTVAWKGCVEARPSRAELNYRYGTSAANRDYDVTDEAPSAGNTRSLFVPYFAPDEPDYSATTWNYKAPGAWVAGQGRFKNNYLADGTIPSSGTNPSATNWGWTLETGTWSGENILKYNKTTRPAIIDETGNGKTYGPNSGCPDAVQRLTINQGQVISKIETLRYWDNGGTIVSEGLMWAWRTLSPNAPYADAQAYGTTGLSKVIVLMTDGVNELNDNTNNATSRNTSNISDYSAYGYLGSSRLRNANGITTYAGVTTHLNNRLLAACTNAKNAGVKIYTVLFSAHLTAAQTTSSTALLQSCATLPSYSFSAADATGLNTAFGAIATSVATTPLHLTK